MHRRLGSATLLQLALPGESNPSCKKRKRRQIGFRQLSDLESRSLVQQSNLRIVRVHQAKYRQHGKQEQQQKLLCMPRGPAEPNDITRADSARGRASRSTGQDSFSRHTVLNTLQSGVSDPSTECRLGASKIKIKQET